jgi:hypothetical protein
MHWRKHIEQSFAIPSQKQESRVVFQRLRGFLLAIPGAVTSRISPNGLLVCSDAMLAQCSTGQDVCKCGAPSGDLRTLPVSVAGYGGASKSCIQDDYTANDNHFQ